MSESANSSNVALAPLTHDDIPLIAGWLSADHVRRYWGDPDENARLLREPPTGTHRAIIEADARKVGVVLWQHPGREELDEAALTDIPTSVIDIDIMIGEYDAIGKGVGPAAIRLVAEQSLLDETVPFLVAACMKENIASVRAFAKAGFVADREFDDSEWGCCILMVFHRPVSSRVLG